MPLLLSPPSTTKPSLFSPRLLIPKTTNPPSIQCDAIIKRASKNANGIRSQLHSSEPALLTSSIGSPPPLQLSQWNLGRKHIVLLNVTACATAISASCLFFSAIPTLLAFKKAAESLEKLLDVTTEELPDTMAAVRLSGMEISDLTMELSDLGQEITQGVRSSTRAVRLAEDRLRRLTTMAPTVSVQEQATPAKEKEGPVLARTARNLREGIVKGRAVFGFIFGITQFSRWALNFLAARRQRHSLKESNGRTLNSSTSVYGKVRSDKA